MTNPSQVIDSSIANRIQTAVERGDLIMPPLPEIAVRLMELLRDEEHAEPHKVADLIENEPAMAASILRMANSASFGGMKTVTDLSSAVARLGMRQVSLLVTAVAHKGNFSSSDPEKTKMLHVLWDHAVATALATRQLAGLGGDDRNEGFLAGLLHDTGKLIVLKGVDLFEKTEGMMPLTRPVLVELMGLLHTALGHQILVEWNIPEPACRAALHHHDENTNDLLIIRVQAANAIARKLGAALDADPDLVLIDVPAIERLNLTDLEMATLLVDVEDEFDQVRGLF